MTAPRNKDEFVTRLGGVYEHSPWVAEESWDLLEDSQDASAIVQTMQATVDGSSGTLKLALIRAHPDLAGRLAVAGELTLDSASEQASAGLDQCSAQEYEQFQNLNTKYVDKFAFPFVMAVRNRHRTDILQAFTRRLENEYEHEFSTAIQEIHKIARMRLEQILE